MLASNRIRYLVFLKKWPREVIVINFLLPDPEVRKKIEIAARSTSDGRSLTPPLRQSKNSDGCSSPGQTFLAFSFAG